MIATGRENLSKPPPSPLDAICQTSKGGTEFWSARDLQVALGYADWDLFTEAIEMAMLVTDGDGFVKQYRFQNSAENTDQAENREVHDFHLTRTACHLIAMNADPAKEQVAAAQVYIYHRVREEEMREADARKMAPIKTAFSVIRSEE